MSRLTRDGTAEPASRDQILRHVRGQGNVHFRCLADHEQDWQPYPVDPYSAICDDHTSSQRGPEKRKKKSDKFKHSYVFILHMILGEVSCDTTGNFFK